MTVILAAGCGALSALCLCLTLILWKRRKPTKTALRSVTRLIFVSTQVSALVWVYLSYGIAVYAAVRLGQVYTMAELSEPAIHTILGVGFLKVLENIFEHNENAVFGKSKEP